MIIYDLWIYNAWIWCIIVYLFLSVLSYHVTSNRILSHSQEQKCLAARMLQKGHLGSLCQAWPRCCCKQLNAIYKGHPSTSIYIYIWCVYISSIHINHQSTSSTSSVIVSGASLIVSLSWKCCNIQSQTCQSRQSKWQDWNLQWKKTNSDGLHKFNAVDFSAIFWVWDFAWLSGTAPACLA